MDEQIKLDKLTAKEALTRYLNYFSNSARTEILEELICDLDNDGIISINYVEIY